MQNTIIFLHGEVRRCPSKRTGQSGSALSHSNKELETEANFPVPHASFQKSGSWRRMVLSKGMETVHHELGCLWDSRDHCIAGGTSTPPGSSVLNAC